MAAAGSGGVRIDWHPGPNVFVANIEDYKSDFIKAIVDLCGIYGADFQAFAQENAPWTDRTSNARQGLDYATIVEGLRITLVLFHRMTYGIYLELANEGRFAIIMQTIDTLGPELIAAAQELIR